MKHQIVHVLQKYVLNPPIKLLFAMGLCRSDMLSLKRQVAKLASRGGLPWATHASAIGYGSWQSMA
jgi:hypothetical protein